jgi:hypothetical protein
MVLLWEVTKKKNSTASISATVVHYAASVTTRPGGLQGIGA